MTDSAAFPIAPRGAPLPLNTGLRSNEDARIPDDVRQAAEEFEAVFLAEMLSPMFENLDTEGLGGGGMGEQLFRPMLVERYAESIANAGGVGIADSIIRELMRLQETVVIEPEADDGAQG